MGFFTSSRLLLNPLVTACHAAMTGLLVAASTGALGSQGARVLLGILAAVAAITAHPSPINTVPHPHPPTMRIGAGGRAKPSLR